MEKILNVIKSYLPQTLQLSKDEIIKLSTHMLSFLDRGPFIQQEAGFNKMVKYSHDPLLINYFEEKICNGQKDIKIGLLVQDHVMILDSYVATQIFRNTIPYFVPAVIETNLKYRLTPLQTTLSLNEEWLKRRALSQTALDWSPLGSIVPLETISVCPAGNKFATDVALFVIDKYIDYHGLPYNEWSKLDKLSMNIVFGNVSDIDTNNMVLYMEQSQSLQSVLNSNELPFPELHQWYRKFLYNCVQNPQENTLASRFIEAANSLECNFISQEIEDQLPFAFFQLSSLFRVFLPIALAVGTTNKIALQSILNSKYEMVYATDNYLHYFVMEVMRLYNQVFILQRESSQDCDIEGVKIKKGDQLDMMFALYMRDKNIYPEPNKFKPMRWVNEKFIDWNIGQHPFSSGSRTCPARNLALNVAKFLIYKLLVDSNVEYHLVMPLNLDFNNMPQVINPYSIEFQLVDKE